jgi:site-specific recombinase XerD
MASYLRHLAGVPCPESWRHPALSSESLALQVAAAHAQQLGDAHGWSRGTLNGVLDGLTVLLEDLPAGERVPLDAVRTRTPRRAPTPRVAEVLDAVGLLGEDTRPPAIRAWIDRSVAGLPVGFADPVKTWLLVLLDGGPRSRPRSHATLYTYFRTVRPFIEGWSTRYHHLREVSTGDLYAALDPLRGHQRRNATVALRALFRFSKKRGVIFRDPSARLRVAKVQPGLVPMTDDELRAVEQIATGPAQRAIVVLAAVHAARATDMQRLVLDDLDLPNRRITIGGHQQRLGDLAHQALQTWINRRRAAWPHTPNPHVLISRRTALGTDPVSQGYLQFHLRRHGVGLDRTRQDRILHEALATGADMLHLALVFDVSHATASRYAAIAQNLLDDELEQATDPRAVLPDEPTALTEVSAPKPVGSR